MNDAGTWRWFYFLTDGNGRELAYTDVNGDSIPNLQTRMAGDAPAGAMQRSTTFDNGRAESAVVPGLSFYRNRYYDQASGTWTQEDPSGIAGGVNLYQYSGNNPIMFSDPFGLECQPNDALCKVAEGVARGTGGIDQIANHAANAAGEVSGINDIGRGLSDIASGHIARGLGGIAVAGIGFVVPEEKLCGAIGRIVDGFVERFGSPIADVVKGGVRRIEFGLEDGSKLVVRGPETHPITRGGEAVTHFNVEVHEPTGAPGRFKKVGNTHLDPTGRVINP